MRAAATPAAAQRFAAMNALMDVRALLPAVRVPTLVVERRDVVTPKGGVDVQGLPESEYVASRIEGAELVVLPGKDYLPWVGDQEALVAEVAAFVTGARPVVEPDRVLLTVVFTDIVDSTGWLTKLGDQRWGEVLTEHDLVVRRALERFGGTEVDRAGDGVFATFDGPARAVRCAQEIAREVRRLALEIRAGVHTGECERDRARVSGIAVHIGARIAALAGPGEVLVSSTVKDLVAGSALRFRERGAERLKGVEGEWLLYSVLAEDAAAQAALT
jgi:class 3 adenylate cyclase